MTTTTIDKHASAEKFNVALSSVVAAFALMVMKVVVGVLTGSLGIISEALHSALDLMAAIMTMFAVRFGDKPADESHTYGHGKLENLSALVETLLLLVTVAWVVYEAIQRLFFHSVSVEANVWSYAVMVISIVVNISRARVLSAVAKKHDSQALAADALHFSSDVFSSIAVIFGLVFVNLGFGATADAIAALAVAAFVAYATVELGKQSVDALMDRAPKGVIERIHEQICEGNIEGIVSCDQVRVRSGGATTFIDVTLAIKAGTSVARAHEISQEVEDRIAEIVPRADVIIHTDPATEDETLFEQVHREATRIAGVADVHNVTAHRMGNELHLSLHLQVPGGLTLNEAHAVASDVENTLRAAIPGLTRVDTHIEAMERSEPGLSVGKSDEDRLVNAVTRVVKSEPNVRDCHRVEVAVVDGRTELTLHCVFDPGMPVERAHQISMRLESELRTQISGLGRVLIHVEPEAA